MFSYSALVCLMTFQKVACSEIIMEVVNRWKREKNQTCSLCCRLVKLCAKDLEYMRSHHNSLVGSGPFGNRLRMDKTEDISTGGPI